LTVCLSLFVAAPTQGQAIDGGGTHTILAKPDGTVWTFGNNGDGQLGDNTNIAHRTAAQVDGLTGVVAVAAGDSHSVALTSSGSVWAWGDNFYGQLGDTSTTDRKAPVLVGINSVVAIAAGAYHTVALRANGDVYAWGRNSTGQLGINSTAHSSVPVLMATGASAIGAGLTHTIVVKTDGTAWATGTNSSGQLGDGTTTQRLTLVQMAGVTNAVAADGGATHSVILLNTGTLKATGNNTAGQVGDGTSTQRTTAVPVSNLVNVTAIEAGADHTLALKSNGTLWSWGQNQNGQLGDGTTTARYSPTLVSVPSTVTAMGAGFDHGVAVDATGVAFSWGRNGHGQLGDGATTDRPLPDAISAPNYQWRVATPVFSMPDGTYTSNRTVVITSVTPDAVIRYTLTGDEPTEADAVFPFGGNIVVTQTAIVKAKAWKVGMPVSATGIATYTLQVATPVVSPSAGTYTSQQSIAVSSSTPGATFYYTTDGTTPTSGSALYTSAIAISSTTTLKVIGMKSNWSTSGIQTATYTMNFGTLTAPVLSAGTGTYEESVLLSMSAQEGSAIHYRTDGGVPTTASPMYTGPIVVTTTTAFRAKAFRTNYATSAETMATLTIRARTPAVNLAAGAYAPGSAVTVTSPDPAATLRFTLNGIDPTASDLTIASGTTMFVGNYTLKVRAFKSGTVDSTVLGATYTLTAPMSAGMLSVGDAHAVIAAPSGALYGWGSNAQGRLGDGTTNNRLTPTVIPTLTGVMQVSSGASHTLAVAWNGQLFAWGDNSSGKLGDGTSTTRTRPVLISMPTAVVSVAAGESHSLALTAAGEVYAWGLGSNGRLGLGSTTSYSAPTLVPGLSNVVAIAAGGSHSLAITAAGQLYAWGLNSWSQLGDGSTTSRLSPTLITTITGVIDIAGGSLHSLALRQDGSVYAWGRGLSGQLGMGNTTTLSVPTMVPNLTATDVAAGGAQSAAIRSDGALVTWGDNASGQLGDTTTTMRTTPTVVGVPALAGVAVGTAHMIAVTPNGHVWTWGNGGSGRLGDGNVSNRSTPQDVFTAAGQWGGAAAPTISLATGTYASEQTAVISHLRSDAVLRYTTSGATPTESDPIIASGAQVAIDRTMTLRVRAWVPDFAASPVVTATYTLTPVMPVVAPGTGTYATAQTVTVTTSTTGAVLRYTLDGSEPTESSAAYTASLNIATTATIKARAFRENWTASNTASATLTFNYGMLSTPVASPGGGSYTQAPVVTLTSAEGAPIRYTLDGSEPTTTSSLYAAPLTIASGTTVLKARAFQTDWTPSAILAETYTGDFTPPTITAQVYPTATPSGWHSTDVTITFTCADASGIANCPAPVTLTQEGAGQVITRTATDGVGHQASTSVTINLDRTPGTVTLSSPTDGTVTNGTSVAVSAQVSDALSGIVAASCNGAPASVSAGQVECNVSLQPGMNSVVVFARDAAGNGASFGVTVQRTGITSSVRVYPATRTLLIGHTPSFALIDEYGTALTSVTWNSSNPNVASIDENGKVTALAAGEVSITATAQSFVGQATVTVAAGPGLPSGTALWTVPPASGSEMENPIYPEQIDDTVPHVFTIETDGANMSTVRAVTSSGDTLWTTVAPGTPVFGDSFGGIVGELRDEFGAPEGVVRFGGPLGTAPWRYESPGSMSPGAQAPDGTIYAIEMLAGTAIQGTPLMDRYIVVMDGQTGRIRTRIPLPRNVNAYPNCQSPTGQTVSEASPSSSMPVVGADGNGYVQVRREVRSLQGTCLENGSNVPISKDVENTLTLMRIEPTGAFSFETLYRFQFSGSVNECEWMPRPRTTMVDGLGGIIATWDRDQPGTCPLFEFTATQFDANAIRTDHLLSTNASGVSDLVMTGDGVAYFAPPGGYLTAIDVATWSTQWTATVAGTQPTALEGGRVALHDSGTGVMSVIDAAGGIVETATLAMNAVDSISTGTWRGVSTATGDFVETTGPRLLESWSQMFFGPRTSRRPRYIRIPYVRVDCRIVDGVAGYFGDHCYLVVRRSRTDLRYTESGPQNPTAESPYGQNVADEHEDLAMPNPAWLASGVRRTVTNQMLECLAEEAAIKNWNDANIQYNPFGPNSNTFISWIVNECNIPARPSPLARAIGWVEY
jgi:alpha-tubulin suppressor-like RCC1 family protein